MDFSRQVNYKSDFDVLLNVKDSAGEDIGFPDFDFLVTFRTNGQKVFEAGQVGGVKRGVSDVSGKVRIAFDNHGLMPGELKMEFRADVEDVIYPDGKKLTVINVPTNITLTTENGEENSGLNIDVNLPFVLTLDSNEEG